MKRLIKYEFLKILRKKSTMIVMALSLLLTVFFFGLPILQFQTYSQEGVMKGLEGIEYNKSQYDQLSVPLTDKYVSETISEVQQLFNNPDNIGFDGTEQFLIGDAYWNDIAPREKLLDVIAKTYAKPGEYAGYNELPKLDLTNEANFYETRNVKIQALLDSPSRDLSEEQKEYWLNMNSNVDTPFQYGYYEGWEIIFNSFELLMFAILAVCIIIAPVFSGEYQTGTAAIILSAKYGKSKLGTAKIIAALLFGVLAFTAHLIVAFSLPLAAFGVDGWNLPVQIAGTVTPYPFTFLEMTLINVGVIYLVLMGLISFTLFLSAKIKSSYMSLVILVPVLFIPMVLTPNGTTGFYNMFLFLLPYRAMMPEISKYISYQFGGIVLDALTVRAILYTVITFMMLPLAKLSFKKHQVS